MDIKRLLTIEMSMRKKKALFIYYYYGDLEIILIMNLMHKKVVSDSRCKLREESCEAIIHSLFHCEQARMVWRLTHFDEVILHNRFNCLPDIFEHIKSVLIVNELNICWF